VSLTPGSYFPSAAAAPALQPKSMTKIGQSLPYIGPYSVYGQIGKAEQAFFAKINAKGASTGARSG
jgi:branched-chain amino acid transport system substrate-binding protein